MSRSKFIFAVNVSLFLCLIVLLVLLYTYRPDTVTENAIPAPAGGASHTQIQDPALRELSGIVPARQPGQYWAHNDSGHPPELFRFNSKGKVLQQVELEGAVNLDWEAMASDAKNNLYIADTGDNFLAKVIPTIYKCKEPASDISTAADITKYRFRYEDKKAHNCEAIFLLKKKLYLITKEKHEGQTVFCIDQLKKQETVTARKVCTLRISGPVTGSAYSPKHNLLAVLTYELIAFYSVSEEAELAGKSVGSIPVQAPKCEALCYDKQRLVLANEPGGIWFYRLSDIIKQIKVR